MGLFGAGDPPCPAGSICSGKARTRVGGTVKEVRKAVAPGKVETVKEVTGGTDIYHATVTSVTQGSDGKVTGDKTEVYVISGNEWKLAATTTDGGQNYEYTDVAGAGLRKDLNNKSSAISKNTQAGTSKALDKAGITSPVQKKAIVNSLSNTAPAEPGPPPGPGGNPPASKPASSLSEVSASGPGDASKGVGDSNETTRRNFPKNLTYPLSLRNSKQDKIQFNMIEYVPGTIGQGQLGSNVTARTNIGAAVAAGSDKKVIGRVFLPIPSGISDTTGAGWGEDRMDATNLALAQVALGFIERGGDGLVKSAKDIIDTISSKDVNADVKKAISTSIAGSASGAGAGLLTRTTGAVLNPNLELLFQGPTLRPFDFVFKLSARSQKESDEIIKIIRFFKQGMAPIRSSSNLFLKSPHTFQIRYLHNDDTHPFLNKFKICALKSLTVNYTPDGNYATFRDGKMVSYELNMSFQELDPIFNDDYTKLDDNKDTQLGF